MNKRIFELAKQVDLIQWDPLPSGAQTPDHESVANAIKFAELLIKQTLEIIETDVQPSFTRQDISRIHLAVNKHFHIIS